MKIKGILALLTGVGALAVCLALFFSQVPPRNLVPPQVESTRSQDLQPPPKLALAAPVSAPVPAPVTAPSLAEQPAKPLAPPNKLEQLATVRETFRALAAGNRTNAINAAKLLKDPNQRETALLALVTEWTHGELAYPGERAQRISNYGLEAGLGMELSKDPELALLWANELTSGSGRTALIQQTAIDLVGIDPAAAFALGDELAEGDQSAFFRAVLAGWASHDTDAALQYADEITDPAERDGAMQAIHSAAPVGIGTSLRLQDGYPVVQELIPGTPADVSGQLHPGDRIVAVAEGSNPFVNTQGLSMEDIVQMVRGAPGSQLQLQIQPADAPPGLEPQIISIVRGQIRFKR